jgi:hypothetical protein
MVFLNINSASDNEKIKKLQKYYSSPTKIFMLIYMDGCGPCNETKPEWKKLENVLNKYNQKEDIVIVDIEHQILENMKLKNFEQPNGFPTILYLYNGKRENYEDSDELLKDRSVDSFVKWIENVLKKGDSSKTYTGGKKTRTKNIKKRNTTKNIKRNIKKSIKRNIKKRKPTSSKGGKWSQKYKNSIDCNNPKGFSQRQHCKYGRK